MSTETIDIVLATGNRDKVRELKPVLEGIHPALRVRALFELGLEADVEETETTLEDNARLKADAIFELVRSQLNHFIALADDTGLEVDALNGEPGVYSARFAPMPPGQSPTYADNVRHLLDRMTGKTDRSARFRTVIAMKGLLPSAADNDVTIEETVEGSVEGVITETTIGEGGFGYDPIFMPAGTGKTFAQLTIDEKNAISHRGRAVQAAVRRIRQLLEQCGL
ncbi:non-canonical purine NTP pyrophosphatase, rdgB/HAM1 family [Chlorobaculum parvum NCIB 8327]|uniref:dITP/XTP pyrophosphatase n=1 Tax=Chlorobaculum parvum (strain DSM 263 / NCIMB 8327) TaxID=517417 RepID=B3QQ94_CHLP8|nr:RdgB/HAM1 family non-canonical purine NTP pyrophosphatase [Chlorobaculum parvum]ACF12097.1 non-canonical purine NTP pyrophosphatase, rdgB/HAM1 family [Chlorobaculum parvum NCIB 8327]